MHSVEATQDLVRRATVGRHVAFIPPVQDDVDDEKDEDEDSSEEAFTDDEPGPLPPPRAAIRASIAATRAGVQGVVPPRHAGLVESAEDVARLRRMTRGPRSAGSIAYVSCNSYCR